MSAAARNNGFRLGIQNVEVEADRVAITTTELAVIETAAAVAPALDSCGLAYGNWRTWVLMAIRKMRCRKRQISSALTNADPIN